MFSYVQTCLIFIIIVNVSQSRKIPPNVAEQWKQMVLPYHKLCLNETHVDPEHLIGILNESRMPDEKEIHCYWKCFHEHKKFIIDGIMDVDFMIKDVYLMTPEVARACVDTAYREENLCQRSYTLVQCMINGVIDNL